MATHMKTLGCRGVVCDGPARDFDEIRPVREIERKIERQGDIEAMS